jgi:hypothetical protein
VLTIHEAVPLLVDACPSYAAVGVSSGDEGEELAALAHHLVDLAGHGDAEEFPGVFEVVERLLIEGDSAAVTLVRTSLLEDLQNITSHRDVRVDAVDFVPLLGPHALEAWEDLAEAWEAAAADPEGSSVRSPVEDWLDLGPTDRRRVQSMTRELSDGTLATPSDVLRYEAIAYDRQLGKMAKQMRVSSLAYLALAFVLVWGAILLVR